VTQAKEQTAKPELWARLAVVLVPFACFARALPHPFARSWDDGRFIVDNPDVVHPSWDALVRMFTTVQFEAYHPLHLLSYWLDVPWVGVEDLQLTATIVHTLSLLLWLVALSLSYALMRELGAPPWTAVLGTLALGVHPAQVEVVCWASGRKDVLALLFVAASLLVQLSAAGPFSARAWIARGLYVCALLSKTTALPLPLFALALDLLGKKRPLRAALLWHLPGLLLGAGVSIAVLTIWREHSMLRQTLGDQGMALVRFTQTLGHQLLTAVWPSRVSPMYGSQSLVVWQLGRSLACASYLVACALAWRSQRGILTAGLLGFGIFLLPASNLVPLYFPLQDRYASLPLFALGVAIAGLGVGAPVAAPQRKPKRSLALDLGYVALICLGLRSLQYAGVWESELRLWGHAVRTQPDADYAYLKLGEVRREAGDLEGAIAAYHGAIRVAPLRTLAHAGLLEVVARRDERYFKLAPARARKLAEKYYQVLTKPEALRAFPAQLWSLGYVRTLELPIQAMLLIDDVPDAIVLQSAQSAMRAGRRSLARFYVHALKEQPKGEPLTALASEPYFRVVP
jgi:tetratricopeptide (TPR) repeat protein